MLKLWQNISELKYFYWKTFKTQMLFTLKTIKKKLME